MSAVTEVAATRAVQSGSVTGLVPLSLLLLAAPALAEGWEAEAGGGIAASNAAMTAPAVCVRGGYSFAHAALSVRALDVAGGDAFSGWMGVAEARLHTGDWLGRARLHLALAGGIGREVAASGKPFGDGDAGGFESRRTGPAFLTSAGASVRLDAITLSVDVAVFYWGGADIAAGSDVNGGVGAALLFGIGTL